MRLRELTAIAILCMGAAIFASTPARAFGLSGVGAKAGYVSPEDLSGTVSISGHLEFEQSSSRVHLLPSLGYWSTDGVHDVSPNLDLYYHFYREGTVTPYLGGGLGMHFLGGDRMAESDVDPGANLFGGLRV